MGRHVALPYRFGDLIGQAGAVAGGEAAGQVRLLLSVDNDMRAVQLQLGQQGRGRHGVAQTEEAVHSQLGAVVQAQAFDALFSVHPPIQQYGYTTGKNATDSAMIIDAMDILHSNKVDGFCIVSSDSDFTRLATRLRESSKMVIGMGEKKTPRPFIVSCDKFIYIENLGTDDEEIQEEVQDESSPQTTMAEDMKKATQPRERIGYAIIKLLRHTIDDLADDNDWVSLAEVGSLLLKKRPDFDPRNYGFQKLTPLIESCPKFFEIEKRKAENSHVVHVFVRLRKGK